MSHPGAPISGVFSRWSYRLVIHKSVTNTSLEAVEEDDVRVKDYILFRALVSIPEGSSSVKLRRGKGGEASTLPMDP